MGVISPSHFPASSFPANVLVGTSGIFSMSSPSSRASVSLVYLLNILVDVISKSKTVLGKSVGDDVGLKETEGVSDGLGDTDGNAEPVGF